MVKIKRSRQYKKDNSLFPKEELLKEELALEVKVISAIRKRPYLFTPLENFVL